MNEEFAESDLPSRLHDAEKAIANHPGYIAYEAIGGLIRSLRYVFVPNWLDLLQLLEHAATDEKLAIELVQNVRPPIIRDQFMSILTRRLHNYLASGVSLADHVRREMKDRHDELRAQYDIRLADLKKHAEFYFMKDLRNYTTHYALPVIGHSLSITNMNTSEQSFTSEVELSCVELSAWDKWSPQSKKFLREAGPAIQLRPIVRKHGELIQNLNTWVIEQLQVQNDPLLDEANRLVAARNSILAGTDHETASRITQERTD